MIKTRTFPQSCVKYNCECPEKQDSKFGDK